MWCLPILNIFTEILISKVNCCSIKYFESAPPPHHRTWADDSTGPKDETTEEAEVIRQEDDNDDDEEEEEEDETIEKVEVNMQKEQIDIVCIQAYRECSRRNIYMLFNVLQMFNLQLLEELWKPNLEIYGLEVTSISLQTLKPLCSRNSRTTRSWGKWPGSGSQRTNGSNMTLSKLEPYYCIHIG